MNTTDQPRAVACIRFVRLAGPLAGQYCNFSTGESVKVTTNGNGLATVERQTWRNSLTICNVLYGVPEHLVCEITEVKPNTDSAWYVCHPDGQDLGLIAPRFATEAEAIAKRDLWNKDVPGHYIMGITEAPSEFSSLPNAASETRRE